MKGVQSSAQSTQLADEVAGEFGASTRTDDQAPSTRRHRLENLGYRTLLVVVILGAWHFASGTLVDKFWISDPATVAERLWTWIRDGTLVDNTLATIYAMIIGYVLGAVVGVIVGFLLGRSPRAAEVVEPFMTALYSLPKVALAPLFILWFGIGFSSKVGLVAMIVFFLVFYNTFGGARSVDKGLLDMASIMGTSRRQMPFKVVLPASAQWIFIGLRLAVPYSLIGAVVAELLASDRGVGYLLRTSSGTFDTAGTFAALVVLMVLGVTMNAVVKALDRRTSRWRDLGV